MAKDNLSGSAIKEIRVSEWDSEHRNRAMANLKKMKRIENTWIRVSIKLMTDGCVITRYEPVKKNKAKV